MLGCNASYASSVVHAMPHTYVYILQSLPYNHACCIMPDLLWTVIRTDMITTTLVSLHFPSVRYTSCRWYVRETLAGSVYIIIHLCVSNHDGVYIHE